MRNVKYLTAVCAAALLSTTAYAADFPIMMPPAKFVAPAEDMGGWYLRGDIGMTNYSAKYDMPGVYPGVVGNAGFGQSGHEFNSGVFYGLGVGYRFNSWLRFDVTGEYRGKTLYTGLDYIRDDPNNQLVMANDYRANLTSWVGLANVYADLGTWWCITPFVGAGVGFAHNTISGWRDIGSIAGSSSMWWGETKSVTNFAWAVHAGLGYKVAPGMTIELAYRYLDLGKASTGQTWTYDTAVAGQPGQGARWNGLNSHDVKIGVRWECCEVPPPPPPPLVRKG